MENITKAFSGVKALESVSFNVQKGDIHALVGENGAGKSTLMKVLSGVYPHGSFAGKILFENKECEFKDVNDSEALGIVIIHQELALIPDLSIAENIFLGNELSKNGLINWNQTIVQTKSLLQKVGLNMDPQEMIKNLGVGQQQLVEIAKALSKEVKLLILDEPTAALNEEDSANLLKLLKEFQKQGMTSILISHKLNEVMQIADRVTVIRDGKTIDTYPVDVNLSEAKIIKDMVGRELSNIYPERKPKIKEKVLFEVKNWSVFHPQDSERQMIHNVNLFVKEGEIVGIAGLIGSGRTEFAMSIFGKSYGRKITGNLYKNGKEIFLNRVNDAIEHGFAYVSEDRQKYGLILIDRVKNNLTLTNLKTLANRGKIDFGKEVQVAESLKERLNIRTPSIEQRTVHLSGGNQQKVVLGKWIFQDPDVLILDEPTRGIDVGAKFEIYKIIRELAGRGKGILMISSELPELIGMCDRIYTLSEGHITANIDRKDADQELLMTYMTQSRGDHNA